MSESTLISRLSLSPDVTRTLTRTDTEVHHLLTNSKAIVDAINNHHQSTSSLYHELLLNAAAVEQTGFAADGGMTRSSSDQALHVLRCLERIRLRIGTVRRGGLAVAVGDGRSLLLSFVQCKIDDLQSKVKNLAPAQRHCDPLLPHVERGRRHSGGRSLRFVDDDDEDNEDDDAETRQSHDGDHRHHLDNDGDGELCESTICGSENGSPIASPPSASRRPPSNLSSRAAQRRRAWKSIARRVDAELSRPCLSLPLFSSEQYSSAPSGDHKTSYALHRRRFRAVKAVDWVETLRPDATGTAGARDSLSDGTLVGDLSELLAVSLSIRSKSLGASASTSRPEAESAVPPPASTSMATFTTTALPALLESQLRYSYKVKPPPPPPPPPPAAPSVPDAPAPALAAPVAAKAAPPASVPPGAPVSMASSAAAAPAKEASVEEEIRRIYAQHNPSKIGDVPGLLKKYAGNEAHLLEKLRKKYEAPSKPATAAATTTVGSVGSPSAANAANAATSVASAAFGGPTALSGVGTTATAPFSGGAAAPTPFSGGAAAPTPFSAGTKPFSGGAAATTPFSGGAAAPTPFSGGAASSLFTPPKANASTGNAAFSGGSLGSGVSKSLFGGAAGSLQSPPPAPTAPQFGGGFGSSGAGKGGAEGIQRRIEEIYRQHNPQKMAEIPQLMLKYAGKELELLDRVQKKYVSQPAAAPSAPSASASLFRSPGAAQGAPPPSFGAGFGSPSVFSGGGAASAAPGTGLATSLFRK